MRSLLLSTSDTLGGAAKAAERLHDGLQKLGVDSQMLVRERLSDRKKIISSATRLQQGLAKAQPYLNFLPLLLYRQREHTPFSLQWVPDLLASQVAQITPDVINLHWIGDGYLQIETLAKLNQPIVWTLHDMWAFTGGCHYSQECDRYIHSCGACPLLHSTREWDISRWVWQRKAKAWKNLNLTIVTPSHWLANCAKASSLFQNSKIEVIPNGIDIQNYKPVDRELARSLLRLPLDKQLILFGAMKPTSDRRKGFHLLLSTLQKLSHTENKENIEVVIFGASQPSKPLELGFKTHYLGKLSDDISLALVYAAADVFVAPSIQDNLPNTVVEALACGTPCVAFKIGGMPDMIEHQQNGYLAQPYEEEDLARGIAWILNEGRKLGDRARQKATQFSQERQAKRYYNLFTEILESV